ncbi:hypothetical protein ACTM9B_13270 [Lachnospiraceae bacterium HCP1S3_A10]
MEWKQYLNTYRELREEINDEEERLGTICPEHIASSGSGGGGGHGKPDRMATQICIRADLEVKLTEMKKKETQMRSKIEAAVDAALKPNEKRVIRLRYIDGNDWRLITQIIYHKRPDYVECQESYKRMTLRTHGHALEKLNKLIKKGD